MNVTMSPTIAKLATALCKVQGEVKCAIKDSTNPHFKSKYADLTSVWEACRKLLADNGLAIAQFPGGDGNVCKLTTVITHSSGEWMSGEAACNTGDGSPQKMGSALTYLRRYSLASVVGIVADDDDGEEAQKGWRPAVTVNAAPASRPPVAVAPMVAAPAATPRTVEFAMGGSEDEERDIKVARADRSQLEALLFQLHGHETAPKKAWLTARGCTGAKALTAFEAKPAAERTAIINQALAALPKEHPDDALPF